MRGNKLFRFSNKRPDPLVLFIALVLGWTWIIGFIPLWFGITGVAADIIFKALVGPSPTFFGILMWLIFYNKKQKIGYLKRCFDIFKAGLILPFTLIFIYASVCGISLIFSHFVFKGSVPEFGGIKAIGQAPYLIFMYLGFALISGPLNEEFGWRGFALDHLLHRYGFIVGSLILGFVWGVWHLPWYFYEGNGQYIMWNIHPIHGIFLVIATMCTSLMCSFAYVIRKRSVVAAALVHMLSNFLVGGVIIYPFDDIYVVTSIYVLAIIELIIVIIAVNTKPFKNALKEVKDEIAIEFANFY